MNYAFVVRNQSTGEDNLCHVEDILDWLVTSLPENPTLFQIIYYDEHNREIIHTIQEFAQMFRMAYVQKRLNFLKSQSAEIMMLEQEFAQLLATSHP